MRMETDDPKAIYSADFDSVLILERGTDLITPMCTQLTYEGLIDEVFGINTSILYLFNL